MTPALPHRPTVSGAYARAWGAFLDEGGLAGTAPRAALDAPAATARLDGAVFDGALDGGRRLLGDPLLGVRFGTRVGGGGFGLLGIAAATAPTFAGAVGALARYESLTSTLGRVTVRREGRDVTLSWHAARPAAPAVVEGILAGWVSFGRHLVGERVPVRALAFAHARGAALSAYEAVLDCPVRFDADETRVTVDAALLDARPRMSDARLHAHLVRWLERCTLGVDAPADRPVTRRVMRWLADEAPLAEAEASGAAIALGVGTRTLQRRLADEGTSFRALLDAARGEAAILGVLSGRDSLSDLGGAVGFDEQSSLCRAFNRWTGYAPLAVRSRLPDFADDLR